MHRAASAIEAKYYGKETRLGETILFAKELELKRIGLAFCIGLSEEAKVLAENWRLDYNHHRPHSSLGYKTPAQFAATCIPLVSAAPRPQEYTIENVDNSLIEVGT